jgi:hypothetical protein
MFRPASVNLLATLLAGAVIVDEADPTFPAVL